MKRRDFLKAAAAVPVLLVPGRRIWQVGADLVRPEPVRGIPEVGGMVDDAAFGVADRIDPRDFHHDFRAFPNYPFGFNMPAPPVPLELIKRLAEEQALSVPGVQSAWVTGIERNKETGQIQVSVSVNTRIPPEFIRFNFRVDAVPPRRFIDVRS